MTAVIPNVLDQIISDVPILCVETIIFKNNYNNNHPLPYIKGRVGMVDEIEIYVGSRMVHQCPPNFDCYIPVFLSSLENLYFEIQKRPRTYYWGCVLYFIWRGRKLPQE